MTKKINTQEVLYWFLARMTQGLMALSVILIVIIIIGDYNIKKMHHPITIEWKDICGNQKHIEEQVKKFTNARHERRASNTRTASSNTRIYN